jgi:hypothetical protein
MGASDHHDEEHETAIVRCGTTKGDITLQLIRVSRSLYKSLQSFFSFLHTAYLLSKIAYHFDLI